MWAMFAYQDVVPPERLVFVNWFSNEAGGVTRNPIVPTWPLETITTLQFDDEPDGKTKVSVTWAPHQATEVEQKTFEASTAEEGELGQQFRSARGLPDEGKLAGDRRLVRLRRKRGADETALARLGKRAAAAPQRQERVRVPAA